MRPGKFFSRLGAKELAHNLNGLSPAAQKEYHSTSFQYWRVVTLPDQHEETLLSEISLTATLKNISL
jgi:hypothetical protein